MGKDSAKLQFLTHRKEIFTLWLSSTFVASHAQSINDSFTM